MMAATALATWYAYWSALDPLVRLASVSLFIGCFLWIICQIRSLRTQAAPSQQVIAAAPSTIDDRRTFLMYLSSGSVENRAEKEVVDGKQLSLVKARLSNGINATVKEITAVAKMRTWRGSDGLGLLTYDDSDDVMLHASSSLNPGMESEFVLCGVRTEADGRQMVFLGDPLELSDKLRIPVGGRHFISIFLSALDRPGDVKNFVFASTKDGTLIAFEYDSRYWGNFNSTPNPFSEYPPVAR